MKSYLIKNSLRLILLVSTISISNNISSQTSSIANGSWNTSGNWNNGVPGDRVTATITNNMTLDVDLIIDKNGAYTFDGGTLDDKDAPNDLLIDGSGVLEVGGNVTIGGDFLLDNKGSFTILGCDTLRVRGNVSVSNNSFFKIDDCAVLYIEGDFILDKNNFSTVNGNIYVEGNFTSNKNVSMDGTGNIEIEGTANLKGKSNIFGSTSGCSSPPCEYGSGTGLPITLKDISVSYIQKHAIEVHWTTSSEVNNDYFTIYYSFDGDTYYQTEKIPGAGNSNVELSYSYKLQNIQSEIVYIKLKQTDFDGAFEEFSGEVAKRDGLSASSFPNDFVVYPNPGKGNVIRLSSSKSSEFVGSTVELIHVSGKTLQSKIITENDFVCERDIEPFSGLSLDKGIYIIRLFNNEQVLTETYIVQ